MRCSSHRRRPSRFGRQPLAGTVLATFAAVAACGNDGGGDRGGDVSPPRTATSTPEGTKSPRPTDSKSAEPSDSATHDDSAKPPTVSPGPPRCTRDRLELSLGRVSPGAGNLYVPLVFTNTGAQDCLLDGYPGVTLLDASGERIGEPAKRSGPERPAVELTPGKSAYATLHTVNKGVSDKPCLRPADRVQAYPPGSTWAMCTDADSFRVCGGVFEVSAVKAGRHP